MIIKKISEIIDNGNYDIKTSDSEMVYLVEPYLSDNDEDNLVHWKFVFESEKFPRNLLHYDDTADGSTKLIRSWQKSYTQELPLSSGNIYSGSQLFFSKGTPNFGGIAKAAIYLRYSKGFNDYIATFDSAVASLLKEESVKFEAKMTVLASKNKDSKKKWEDNKTLPQNWNVSISTTSNWGLASVCKLSTGKHIVLFLNPEYSILDDLLNLDIDFERSFEIMKFLSVPDSTDKELIDPIFQAGTGNGRNAFSKDYKLDSITDSEYIRLMGTLSSNRNEILNVWSNKLEYKVNVAPDPKTSSLLFLPEGTLGYSELKTIIDTENANRSLFFESIKKKKEKTEDSEKFITTRPNYIPTYENSTIFLIHTEGSQKKKIIVQQIFPSVSLIYLQLLNYHIMQTNIEGTVVGYMKKALTSQTGETPSVYKFWTYVLTSALQKNLISANEVFYNFQRFAKAHRTDELVGSEKIKYPAAKKYFDVIDTLSQLQYIIFTARENPDFFINPDFFDQLETITNNKTNTKGVFGKMNTEIPLGITSVGPIYEVLWDWQKTKLDSFIKKSFGGVPEKEFSLFARGALTGMLLNELNYSVKSVGRSFNMTMGRQPSRLRGAELQKVFLKGIDLLTNLGQNQKFNSQTLPFLKSFENESLRDSFNSGLIMGMVYYHKTEETENSTTKENKEAKQ